MKPSKNAFIGYSYQQCVTFFLLAKMDVERKISKIEIEADIDNNFDDIKIICRNSNYNLQIKDFKEVTLDNLKISKDKISINGKSHILSKNVNVLFFKNINFTPNCEIFDFPAFKNSKVYIVSLSRSEIADKVNELYESNHNRESIVRHFFDECLDKRKLLINRKDLPTIDIFNTQLIEPTINIGKNHLKVENILVVEGKPGVGKSHFVNCLKEDYINNLVYRFWVSNQDKDYQERLKYNSFIFDFSKQLFKDLINRDEDEIIQKIQEEQITVIIDGLDHIENYNNHELEDYVDFISRLSEKCKTIVLTRPLKRQLKWKIYLLDNWNFKQTEKVLNELYHISEYDIVKNIYSITNGYPILIRFIAEHYKKHEEIPKLKKLENIDNYYEQIIKQEKGKQALSLFLCSRSFFMKSEIKMFLEEELTSIVFEYLEEHPYLFEIRLNRVSLFHDSFITYLRKQNINYSNRLEKINKYVYQSIMDGHKRFLSRFSFFDLEIKKIKDIVKKYTSIEVFRVLTKDTIDFESIPTFYFQIREALSKLSSDDLDILNYYDLALIINLVERDHVSKNNKFLYTYLKSLMFNGYSEEDITSSSYLFAMLYYIKTDDGTLLYNNTSNDYFSTEYFYEELENEVEEENLFFDKYTRPLSGERIKELLQSRKEYDQHDLITFILENLYINQLNLRKFSDLSKSINKYMNAEEKEGISILESFLSQFNIRDFFAAMYLKDAKRNILASGNASELNDYKNLSLKDFITKYQELGSFDTWVEILYYLRLSLHEDRKIDIQNIAPFWTKYHQRKDYSVFNIAVALTAFEEKGFINKQVSCNLINSIQNISEKGYRGLLAEFIMLHSLDIIQFLIESFNIDDLIISWLELPSKYINVLPDNIFQSALMKELEYHRSNKEIDCKEIINVFHSDRKEELKYVLNLKRYKIRISKFHPRLEELKKENIDFVEFVPDSNGANYEKSSVSRYNQGILSYEDKDYILEKKLKSFEVAGFSNGYYAVFSDMNIYKLFGKDDIKNNFKQILYNAILGKIESINSFCSLYYFLGNLPKIVADYEIETNFKKLFDSFSSFLNLSMLKLNSNNLN